MVLKIKGNSGCYCGILENNWGQTVIIQNVWGLSKFFASSKNVSKYGVIYYYHKQEKEYVITILSK